VSSRDCQAIVSVLVRGERYEFEMKADNALYVAVGLSEDAKMVSRPQLNLRNRPLLLHISKRTNSSISRYHS